MSGCVASMVSRVRVWIAAAVVALASAPASAAKLEIDFSELASVVATLTQGAKLHLHNAPATGLISALTAQPSYFEFAGHQTPVDVPSVDGWAPFFGSYSYYVNDVNMTKLTVSAVSGAVRIVMQFDETGYEITPSDERLPSVQWTGAAVVLDLRPIKVGNSMSLEAVSVQVKGNLNPVCTKPGFLCTVVVEPARPKLRKMPAQLSAQLKSIINSDKIRNSLAKALDGYLTLGTLGHVQIKSVKSSTSSTTISFCLQGC